MCQVAVIKSRLGLKNRRSGINLGRLRMLKDAGLIRATQHINDPLQHRRTAPPVSAPKSFQRRPLTNEDWNRLYAKFEDPDYYRRSAPLRMVSPLSSL